MPAEISSGGVNLNSIPKDGGNIFSGAAFLGGFMNAWQSDNITDELRARGSEPGERDGAHPHLFRLDRRADEAQPSVVLLRCRHADADEIVADTPSRSDAHCRSAQPDIHRFVLREAVAFRSDCGPATSSVRRCSPYMRDVMVRLTTQLTQRNKFAIFFNRGWKDKDNEYGFGTDPVFASNVRDNKEGLYPWGYVKWTSTPSSKVLLEAGWAWSVYAKTIDQKPYNDLPYLLDSGQVNPAWIGNARGRTAR